MSCTAQTTLVYTILVQAEGKHVMVGSYTLSWLHSTTALNTPMVTLSYTLPWLRRLTCWHGCNLCCDLTLDSEVTQCPHQQTTREGEVLGRGGRGKRGGGVLVSNNMTALSTALSLTVCAWSLYWLPWDSRASKRNSLSWRT